MIETSEKEKKRWLPKTRISHKKIKFIEILIEISFEILLIILFILDFQNFLGEFNLTLHPISIIINLIKYLIYLYVLLRIPIHLLKLLNRSLNQIIDENFIMYKGKKYYFDGKFLQIRPKIPIRSIKELKRLEIFSKSLENLNLSKNSIKKIDFPKKFPNLKYLNLNYNEIQKIENLEKLPKLKSLEIKANLLSEISNFSGNEELKIIDASKNFISRINLPKKSIISNLNLEKNNLKTLEDFGYLYNLGYLNVSHNQIQEIKYLEFLVNLQYFNSYKNPLLKDPVRPKFTKGKSWVKYCQLNQGPKIINKLSELLFQIENQKRLRYFIKFNKKFFESEDRVYKRNTKKNRGRISKKHSDLVKQMKVILKRDLKNPLIYCFLYLVILMIYVPWTLEIISILSGILISNDIIGYFYMRSVLIGGIPIFYVILLRIRAKKNMN